MYGEEPGVVVKMALVTVAGLPGLSAQDLSCCCSSVEFGTVVTEQRGAGDEGTETSTDFH